MHTAEDEDDMPELRHVTRVANRSLFQRTVLYLNPPSLSFIKLRIVLYF